LFTTAHHWPPRSNILFTEFCGIPRQLITLMETTQSDNIPKAWFLYRALRYNYVT
jgi:hypothetical protein